MNQKRKILMLNHEFPPVGGGAAPVTFELSKQLARIGHRVDVVTMHYGSLPRFETVEGVNIYRTPAIRKKPNICYTHEMATYVPGALPKTLTLAKREKYDVIHCHFIIPAGPLALTVSKLTGTPFLITCHGSDIPGYNPDRFTMMHKLLMPAWRFIVRRTLLLTSPSQALKELILSHYEKANVTVIPNGINSKPYKPDIAKENHILMCSRLLPRKGFQYAIQAVKQLSADWQVDIVGQGPYINELKRIAQNSKIPIRFWGWLDKSDTRFYELFKKSSIFVFPSEAESFGMVIAEAMAAGNAIIASDIPAHREVLAEAGLFVQPRDVAAIRANLEKLIASEHLRQQLAAAALERVQSFNWENVAGRFAELYEQII